MKNALLSIAVLVLVESLVPLALAEPHFFETGVIVPLSGPVAEYGVAIKNGIELAQAENSASFASCKFHFEDSAYKTPQALSAMQKLANQKVSLIYAFGGPMGEALAPVAERQKLPLITDGIDPSPSHGREYVSRYANDRIDLGGAIAALLHKRGIKRAVLVKTQNQYIDSLVEGFIESARGKFEVEIAANVNPEDGDLRFLVPRVVSQKFDALGIFLMPGQISSFARLLKGQITGVQFFGGDFLESPVEVAASQGMLLGAIYPNNVVDTSFRRRYAERYKNESQFKFAAEGYDVARLIADTLCSAGAPLTAEEILKRLYNPAPRLGAQGETAFKRSPKGDKAFVAPVVAMRVTENGFEPVSE